MSTTTPAAQSWTARYPGRLDAEVTALEDLGYRVRKHHHDQGITLTMIRDDGPVLWRWLGVTIPPGYPWVGPHVAVAGRHLRRKNLPRHVMRASGALCLEGDGADHGPTWLIAELLRAQLPHLGSPTSIRQDVTGPDRPAAAIGAGAQPREERVAVSMGSWLPAEVQLTVLLPAPPDADRGMLVAGCSARTVLDLVGDPSHFVHGETVPWVRLQRPLRPWRDTAATLWAEAHQLLGARTARRGLGLGCTRQVLALLVRDEIRYQETGWAWVTLVRTRDKAGGRWQAPQVARSQRAGREIAGARSPSTQHLATRTVILVGAGALGSQIASLLTRGGLGRLEIVDPGIVDAGSSCRQHRQVFAGMNKSYALASDLVEIDSHLICQTWRTKAGSLPDAAWQVLAATCSLVIDAAADPSTTRLLSARARELGLPLLSAAGTAGGVGGWVLSLGPTGACYRCVEEARAHGLLPIPPSTQGGLIEVESCARGTYTASAADLTAVAVHAAQAAISVLRQTARVPARIDVLSNPRWHDGLPEWQRATIPPSELCQHKVSDAV